MSIIGTSITHYETEGPMAGITTSLWCKHPEGDLSDGQLKQYLIHCLVERNAPTGLYSLDLCDIGTGKTKVIKIWFEKR